MHLPSQKFKQSLASLHSQIHNYFQKHKSKVIPIQQLVIILQKYSQIQPVNLQSLLSRCIDKTEVSWEELLDYMQLEIGLEDQVNKMKLIKMSTFDVGFRVDFDQYLDQNFGTVMAYLKNKSTNYFKFVCRTQFLGFKMLVFVLQKEAIFYDCQQKAIIRVISLKYNNVRSKILTNHHAKEKSDHYNMHKSKHLFSEIRAHSQKDQLYNQEMDKVPSMSRRTQQHPKSFSLKSRKNTTKTEQLKNAIGQINAGNTNNNNNMKNSKVCSSASAESDNNLTFDAGKRPITMMDFNYNSQTPTPPPNINPNPKSPINRQITRVFKHDSLLSNNSIKIREREKEKSGKKQMIKVRSNDTSTILKMITDSKIQSSMEVIKAYKNSIQGFQKYMQVDKSKLEKERDLFEEYKIPSGINMKFDYKTQIKKMRTQSRELSLKKKHNQTQISSITETRVTKAPKSRTQTQQSSHNHSQVQNQSISNAFTILEKKILEIQSISFCDHFMLVSLMNCQVRLYSFKRTIHGFMEEIVWEKCYHTLPSFVLIFKSSVRKKFNACVVLGKATYADPNAQHVQHTSQDKQPLSDLRTASIGLPKSRQTELLVYQLSPQMQISKPVHISHLSYCPIITSMLPLGLAGHTESGLFFLLQLNNTSTSKSQQKSIDTQLCDPDTRKRVSISCLKCHPNMVFLYIGCKTGDVYVYDRFTSKIRVKGKISAYAIQEIMFVGTGEEIMFWDAYGKIGVASSATLQVSNIVAVMSGHGVGGGYFGMVDYFVDNQFIVYGERTIGLVSLLQNQQKKFNAQKPIKIYNRRQKLKGKSTTPTPSHQPTPQKKQNHIKQTFISPLSLILLSSTGEFLIFSQGCTYIGSYFCLNFHTITQCKTCQSNKYLYLLHQNNQMQVVNIYTQQQILGLYNVKDEIYDVFFTSNTLYFCGYMTAKYVLVLYGGGGEGAGKGRGRGGLEVLVQVCLEELVLGGGGGRDSGFSRHSAGSLSTNSLHVDLDLKFYKGSMVLIKKQAGQITFLYKKTFARNSIIKCSDYIPESHPKSASFFLNSFSITHSYMNSQSQLLSVILSNNVLMIISLQTKLVQSCYQLLFEFSPQVKDNENTEKHKTIDINKLINKDKPNDKTIDLSIQHNKKKNEVQKNWTVIEHFVVWHEGKQVVSAIWRSDNEYAYTLHELNPNKSDTFHKKLSPSTLRYKIQQQPLSGSSPRTSKMSIRNRSWQSQPFLMGSSVCTMHSDKYINMYRLKQKQKAQQNEKTKVNMKMNTNTNTNTNMNRNIKMEQNVMKMKQNRLEQFQILYQRIDID